jgi:hypothetical protein
MNPSTGIFTAPRPGKYFFGYSGIANNIIEGSHAARVDLLLNGVRMGKAYSVTSLDTFALQSTLELKEGDQITLFLVVGGIYDSDAYYTNFFGWLVEEDDVFNVK